MDEDVYPSPTVPYYEPRIFFLPREAYPAHHISSPPPLSFILPVSPLDSQMATLACPPPVFRTPYPSAILAKEAIGSSKDETAHARRSRVASWLRALVIAT